MIHSNGLKSHLCLAPLALHGCPVVWHIHDYYSQRPRIRRLVSLASRRATAGIAISKSIAVDMRTVARHFEVEVVENCVDTDYFQPGQAEVERLDSIAGFSPSTAPRVGLVATYANWKGHQVFLQAIARLPEVRAYIVGGPIYTTAGSQWTVDALRGQARELGISDRVGFVPFQSEPGWVYRSLDVVVHASTRPEPFGLTIVEAMACGRSVVVSAAGGARDLFVDGLDAVGHSPGDVDSLSAAIERLSSDPELRRKMGEQARRTALERYSPQRFGHSLLCLYDRLLSR